MVEALDRFAASLVARLEHDLTCADPHRAARLRSQLTRLERLEATTAAAAAAARRTRVRPAGEHTETPAG